MIDSLKKDNMEGLPEEEKETDPVANLKNLRDPDDKNGPYTQPDGYYREMNGGHPGTPFTASI